MPRKRIPLKKAEIEGKIAKTSTRFKGRKTPKSLPLGDPFPNMTDAEKEAWFLFTKECPWLRSCHRAVLQLGCILRARFNNGEFSVSLINSYSAVLSKLGASPSDDTRINYAEDEEDDETERFFH